MKITKRHIFTAGIAIVTITGAALYWQYTKFKSYAIKLFKVNVRTISLKDLDIDIVINVTNPSDIPLTISQLEYEIFLNDKPISHVVQPKEQPIGSGATSPVTIKVQLNPQKVFKDLKMDAADILLNLEKNVLKVVVSVKVGLWKLKFKIPPYTYSATFKELMTSKNK